MNMDLYLKRMDMHDNRVSQKLYKNSNLLMDKLFDRDIGYKQGKLYDTDGKFLEDIDFKYQYHASYTIAKDKVEFYVQFRPYYHPETKYLADDGIERLGFILDIPNDNDVIEKWLVLGRNDTLTFTRYNILKCNWTFKWVADGIIYESIGCIRNRNNYNSGVWSDGFVTTVQNEIQFIVPSNDATKTIDYDHRFMLSDNVTHPKVYSVSKVEDTFPLGAIKITLTQAHYDAATDNAELGICNYYDSAITPIEEGTHVPVNATLSMNGISPILHKGGSARKIEANITDENGDVLNVEPQWYFKLNGVDVDYADLTDYVFSFGENKRFVSIKALFSAKVKDILTVEIDSSIANYVYHDSIELEVQA